MEHHDYINELNNMIYDTERKNHLEKYYESYDDYPDENGRTTLHHLILNYSLDLIKILIKKKVNINILDNYGNTPLHYAFFREDYSLILKLFIKNNAKINIQNQFGDTPSSLRRDWKKIYISLNYH